MVADVPGTGPHDTTFRSTLAGVTVEGRAHSLSAWFVLALRVVLGFAFFWSGAEKVLGDFDARGYLLYAAGQNDNPLEGAFVWMGQTDWFVAFVNVAVPWGEVAIGLGSWSVY